MQEIKAKFKFSLGDEVMLRSSKRTGIIVRRWCKATKVLEGTFIITVSYTVKPEKTYNQFKVDDEGDLILLERDGMGEVITIPF